MKISKISVKCCTVLFFVFLLSVLTCYPQVWAVEVPFSGKITIGAGFDGAESVFAADVDGDGDMDVLGAAYDADEIAWWENIAGDASTWIKHSIDNMFDGAKSVSAADLDNDGDMDILGAAYLGDKVAWWENTVGDGSQWIIHIIDSDFGRAESVYATDMDSDGDIDVLCNGNEIAKWKNIVGDASQWTKYIVNSDTFDICYNYRIPDSSVVGCVYHGYTEILSGYIDEIQLWRRIELYSSGGEYYGYDWIKLFPYTIFGGKILYTADMDNDGILDLVGASASSGEIIWWGDGKYWIENNFEDVKDIHITDLNGDGYSDVLGVSSSSGEIAWWKNITIIPSVKKHTLFSSLNRDPIVYSTDLDGDGDTDMIEASTDFTLGINKLIWWENAVGDGSIWINHSIRNIVGGVRSIFAADLDDDGDTDILIANSSGLLFWWENAAGNASTWKEYYIDTCSRYETINAADIDGDRDTDILLTTGWLENTSGDASVWIEHTDARGVYNADMDNDGDMDILRSTHGITWLENTVGNASEWSEHYLDSSFDSVRVYAADVDGDGDIDVLGATINTDEIVWWENIAGNATEWTIHEIDSSFDGALNIHAADVDGDGDNDVLGYAINSHEIAWWENASEDASVWIKHNLDSSFYLDLNYFIKNVYGADFDSDGTEDIMAYDYLTGRVVTWIAKPGQFHTIITNPSPGNIREGNEDDVLKLSFRHNGKNGDVDIELSNIEILIEESPGTPLSSAQTDTIFDEIAVYLDTDSNGEFSPVDRKVIFLNQFSLTDGKLTIPFCHYDENVKVSFGSPKTFFIAVKLSPDAYFRTPDQFHITFLSAKAKYRDHAIELYHSHNNRFNQVPTGIIRIGDATPPVIMGLIDSDIPVKVKEWEWMATDAQNGITFRYAVDQNPVTNQDTAWTDYAYNSTATQDDGNGVYYLHVQAADPSGNKSGIKTVYGLLDNTPPHPPYLTSGLTQTNNPYAQWTWTPGTDGINTFRYKLDDSNLETGTTLSSAPFFTPGLPLTDGFHTLYIQGMDAAGNWSATAEHSIETDTGLPCSQAYSPPSVTEAGRTFEITYTYDDVYSYNAETCGSAGSGTGVKKVELYVKWPGDADYLLTDSDEGSALDGKFTYTAETEGLYYFYTKAADYAGNKETAGDSDSGTLYSSDFAGYAIIAVGSVSDGEGLESHTRTGAAVFRHMKNRNFMVSDDSGNHWTDPLDHVKFFTPYKGEPVTGTDDYSVNPDYGKAVGYKEAVEYAITEWAAARINEIRGPLWLVLIDHGSEDMFFLNGFAYITPQQLDEWLDILKSKLPADYNYPITVVMGSCYSGSFIDSLAAPGRIIISSAAADEVSYRGPRAPGLYRDGEFFVSGLFNEMGKGSTLYTAYTLAVELTENHTDSGLAGIKAPYFDTARQHPYFDDDGNPGTGIYSGSHTPGSGGDGDVCKLISLGYGAETVPLEITTTGKEKQVLAPSENSNLLWAKTNFAGDPKNIRVWVEIREPDLILESTGSAEETSRIVDTVSDNMEWNASAGRYETTYTGFDLPGRYTLFFYAMGTDELISHPKRTYVYKSLENSPPDSFTLLSPANGEKVPLTFLADWTDAADPDGDALTYTVTVSRNADLSAPVTEKTGLIYSHAVLSGTDGITDKNTYYWKVTVTDGNGGTAESAVRSFTADSTVNPTDIIAEGSVFDAVSGLPIPGAGILYGTAVLKSDANGGYAKVLPWQVNYTVTVSAAGYGTESFTVANISEGDPVHENFGLYSLSNPGSGNIDGQNGVTLADAVLVLKILAGADTGNAVILKQADADGDGIIGPAEAVFILQKVAELRE